MLGFVVKPRTRYIRQETVYRAKNKIKMMCENQCHRQETRAVANSYFGIFWQAKSWNERKKLAVLMGKYGWWFSPKLDKVILSKGAT